MPTTDDMQSAEPFPNPWEKLKGPLSFLAVLDNQVIGKLFMGTAIAFFVVAGLMALVMRAQLAVPENNLITPEAYNRLFTMHGSTMMYLVVVPFLEGFGIYVLPMMLGSRDVAYPYVTAFSYWTYLFGGLCFYASFLTGHVPNVGWFAYPPLAGPHYSSQGTDFWSLALTLVSVGDLAAGSGLTISVLKLRAPGMSINRMPLFAWAWLVTGMMITFAFTTLADITTLMLPLDRTIGTHFFDPGRGGSALLWQHLFWFFGHPEVYIMFIPATGVVSAVIPVFARRPMVGYTLVAVAIVMTAFVSFGLWVHHMFATGLPWLSMSFFTAASLMIALASGTQVFAWIATLWRSRPSLKLPMLYMLAFLSLFVIGGLTGVMIAVVPFDWQVHDTYFLVAHFHYVLIGGVVFPVLGSMYYWQPKVTGRMMNDRMGQISFYLSYLGFNLTFFPMHLLGFQGMPRRVYTFPANLKMEAGNLAATIGAFILGAGFALFLLNAYLSSKRGELAPDDPWRGETLEWALSSPPPADNWRVPPIVHSRHPMWASRSWEEGTDEEMRVRRVFADTPKPWRFALITTILDADPQALQPWPRPSYIPFAISLTLTILLIGTLAHSKGLIYLGVLTTVLCALRWYRPDDELVKLMRDAKLDKRSGLPIATSGPISLDFWGVIFCMTVLAVIYGNFFYSYFYIRLYSTPWPQDHLPRPDLLTSAILFALPVAAAPLAMLARRAFKADKAVPAGLLLTAGVLVDALFLVGEKAMLAAQTFTPQTDAYGSLFFVIQWIFEFTVLVGLVSNMAALLRVLRQGTDKMGYAPLQVERATMLSAYVAGIALLVYGVLYVSPYL